MQIQTPQIPLSVMYTQPCPECSRKYMQLEDKFQKLQSAYKEVYEQRNRAIAPQLVKLQLENDKLELQLYQHKEMASTLESKDSDSYHKLEQQTRQIEKLYQAVAELKSISDACQADYLEICQSTVETKDFLDLKAKFEQQCELTTSAARRGETATAQLQEKEREASALRYELLKEREERRRIVDEFDKLQSQSTAQARTIDYLESKLLYSQNRLQALLQSRQADAVEEVEVEE